MGCIFAWGVAVAGWGCFSYSLANNLTDAKAFRNKLGEDWKRIRKQWAAGNTSAG
jgi:hypothetical protein